MRTNKQYQDKYYIAARVAYLDCLEAFFPFRFVYLHKNNLIGFVFRI